MTDEQIRRRIIERRRRQKQKDAWYGLLAVLFCGATPLVMMMM